MEERAYPQPVEWFNAKELYIAILVNQGNTLILSTFACNACESLVCFRLKTTLRTILQ